MAMGAKVKRLKEAPKDVLSDVTNAILEMPTYYQVSGHDFYLYPPSLGVTMLIGEAMKLYKFDKAIESGSIIGLYKLFKEQKQVVAHILALCSFENRRDATKKHLVQERIKELSSIDANDGAALIMHAINYNSEYEDFVKHFGIDEEYKQRKKVYELKERESSGMTFGGLSIWGSLLDAACERYGWTMDYVLWEISALNLNMLMADAITSVFLTEDEEKELGLHRHAINADDPRNAAMIRALLQE